MAHCRRLRAHGVVVLAAALLALLGAPSATPQNGLPHVTLFGDSVAEELRWQPVFDVLSQGVDLDLQTLACRRIVDTGCDIGGGIASSVFDALDALNDNPGQTVVMVIGYNEFTADWVKSVGDLLDRLEQDKVKHIFWLTLHEAEHDYIWLNQQLGTFTAQHPELTILDWNAYSRSHPDWFQGDGIHMVPDGSLAMASFIHSALVDAGIAQPPQPPPSTTTTQAAAPVAVVTHVLPAAVHGQIYRALLSARGGKPPYRWRRDGRLPHGFLLASDGLVTGIPRVRPGTFTVPVTVTDAKGHRASRHLVVRVS